MKKFTEFYKSIVEADEASEIPTEDTPNASSPSDSSPSEPPTEPSVEKPVEKEEDAPHQKTRIGKNFADKRIKVGGPDLVGYQDMIICHFECDIKVPLVEVLSELDEDLHLVHMVLLKPGQRTIDEGKTEKSRKIRSTDYDVLRNSVIMTKPIINKKSNSEIMDLYEEYADAIPTKDKTTADLKDEYQGKLEALLTKLTKDSFDHIRIESGD